MKEGFVYILTNQKNGTLYVGVTSKLVQRIYQHRMQLVDGFTKKYDLKQLVYYEGPMDISSALSREKQLKRWNRSWKLQLIENKNPRWEDLYPHILGSFLDPGSSPG